MRPVSNEKRELIIEAKKRGETEKNIMKWIKNTSRSSIGKIWKQYRTTGTIQPKPYKGNNIKITKETEEKIKQTIKEKPDTTLQELIDELNLNVTQSGLSRRLKKMGFTYKKRPCPPKTAKTTQRYRSPRKMA
jgi:transposase